jgi:hypothetical protein
MTERPKSGFPPAPASAPALALAFALVLIGAGCGACTPPDEAYRDWDEVVLSEETLERAEEEERLRESGRTDAEKREEAAAWYAQSLEAARAEEQELAERLKWIRETEALPELSGELRAEYARLAEETEKAIAACREEQARLKSETERIESVDGPPPDWEEPRE